jgi:hypothetical protein
MKRNGAPVIRSARPSRRATAGAHTQQSGWQIQEAVSLLAFILEIPGSILGWSVASPDVYFAVSRHPAIQMPSWYFDYATAVPFQILFSSSFVALSNDAL